MLGNTRDAFPSVPRGKALQAIAKAFNVSESTVTAVAFEAMGYDLEAVRSETDLSTAPDGQLVSAMANRLGVDLDKDSDRHGRQSAPIGTDDDPGGFVAPLNDFEDEARQRAVARNPYRRADLAARRTSRQGKQQRLRERQDQEHQ